jgi:hypothetical protein
MSMKLAEHRWATTVGTARLGSDQIRVVRPARPMQHITLHESRLGAELTVHRDNLTEVADLAAAWWLAARSPRTLIHLPLRTPPAICSSELGDRPLDLVLLHHSLGFPPSRWKQVRAQLSTAGARQSVDLPAAPFPTITLADHMSVHHREFRDHFQWTITADTLFLTGSRRAFELRSDQIRKLVEDFPADLAQRPDWHCCAELNIGGPWKAHRRRSPSAYLHIQYCDTHL